MTKYNQSNYRSQQQARFWYRKFMSVTRLFMIIQCKGQTRNDESVVMMCKALFSIYAIYEWMAEPAE